MEIEGNNRQSDLIKSTAIIGFGYIIPAIINLLLLPLYTMELTEAEYGFYELLVVIAAFAVPIIIMRLDAGLFRFLISVRNDIGEIKKLLSSVLIAVILAPIIFLFVIFIPVGSIDLYLKVTTVIYIYLNAIYATMGYLVRGLGRNDIYTKMVCIQFSLLAIFSLLLLHYYHLHLMGVLIAMNIATVISISYAFISVRIIQYISISCISIKCLKEVLKYSLPMVPNSISMWIVTMSDRVIVTGVLGLGANATYAIANKFPMYMSQITSVFNMSWQENASMYIEDKDSDKYFSSITNSILRVLISMGLLLIGYTPILLKIFIRMDYSGAYNQIPILVLGLLFSCVTSHYGSIFVALKETTIIGFTSVIGAIINIVINILLIKRIGLYAASVSTMLSFGIIMLVRWQTLKKYIKITIDKKQTAIGMGLLLVLSVVYYFNKWNLNALSAIIASIFAVISNRRFIYAIIMKIRK